MNDRKNKKTDGASRFIIKNKALKSDYVLNALERLGYTVMSPYRDTKVILRAIRLIWFKLGLRKDIWYDKSSMEIETDNIIVYDAKIVPEYLKWLCETHPNTNIEFHYSNRVDSAKTKPSDVQSKNLVYSSYDQDDCIKYGMRYTPAGYLDSYCFSPDEKQPPEFDVIYLGRDKGRGEALLQLQKEFENMGLKTYFHICADQQFLRFKKRYYKATMPYEKYIDLLKRTKSHLNYVQEGQTSITQRDMESVFDSVKCITNNKGIRDFELYDPSRFFILGQDDLNGLPAFLDTPFLPVPKELLDKYRTR